MNKLLFCGLFLLSGCCFSAKVGYHAEVFSAVEQDAPKPQPSGMKI